MSEKTRVSVNVATLFAVLFFTATGVWSVSAMKSEVDKRVSTLELNDIHNCNKIEEIEIKQGNDREIFIQNQKDLTEIKTDIKWIRSIMEP